jgi:AraC-like DNA-binding protein
MHIADATGERWSEPFIVDSPRWVIPQRGAIAFVQQTQCATYPRTLHLPRNHQYVCSPLSVLAIDRSAPYQMRKFASTQVVSTVIIPKTIEISTSAASMSVAQVMRLRELLQRMHDKDDVVLAVEELCASLPTQTGRSTIVDSYAARSLSSQRARRAVQTAHEYLCAYATRRLTLADIANAASASPFHLARAFRHVTGVTLHQMQLQLRMVVAMNGIEDGERDLTRLALELGFTSHSHFSKTFREHVGCTPSAYRARSRSQRIFRRATIANAANATQSTKATQH